MRQQQRSFSRDEEHPAFGRFFEVFDESKPQPEADLTVDQIYIYVRRVFTKAELYVECLVTAGVLLERVLDMNAGLLLTSKNWKYLTLSTMILASKLCDDESHNNSEWQYLNRDYRPRLVNDMESALLLALDFNVAVSASAYAAFYFDLRSISFLSTVQRKTELLSSNDNASTTTTTTTTTTTAKKPRRNSQLIQPALAERIITKRGTAVVTPPTAVRQMGTGTTTSTHSLRRCKSARDFDDPESFSPGSLTVIEHLVDMSPKRVDVMRKQPPPERPYIKKGDVDRVAVCSPDMETTGNKRTFDLCQRANLLVREKQQPQQVAVRQPHRPLRQPHQQEKQQQHGRRHTVTSNSTVTTIKMRFGGMSPRVAVCSPDFDDAVPDFDEYDDAQNNNNNDKNNNSAASAAESSLRLPGINNGPTGVSQWRTWSPLALFQAPSDFFKAKH